MVTVRTACCNKTALEFPRSAVLCAPYISHDKQQLYSHNTQRLVVPVNPYTYCKRKAVPGQTWTDTEVSRGWGSQICRHSAHEGGKIVSLCTDRLSPQGDTSLYMSVTGWVDPGAILRPEWLLHSNVPIHYRGSKRDLPACSAVYT